MEVSNCGVSPAFADTAGIMINKAANANISHIETEDTFSSPCCHAPLK